MNKSGSLRHLAELLLAIFVMSSSGALGRYLDLPVPFAIWARCAIAAVALFSILLLFNQSIRIRSADRVKLVLPTLLMGAHWLTYFHALKLSGVAVGMLTLFTYPLMTSLLEPFMLKIKPIGRHIPLAFLALLGIYFLVPEFNLANDQTLGVLFGLMAALTYSVRNILIRKNISNISGVLSMGYQLVGLSVLLAPSIFLFPLDFQNIIVNKGLALLSLGIITTAIGHTLFVKSFGYLTVTTVSILSNLTPILGIILGALWLGEIPERGVYFGGSIILMVTIIEIKMTANSK